MSKPINPGFTIIELITAITVTLIIAAMMVFGFSSWRTSVATNEVKNDLINASTAAKNYLNFNNTLPTSEVFATLYEPSTSVTLVYDRLSDTTFCFTATSDISATFPTWYLSSASPEPNKTGC